MTYVKEFIPCERCSKCGKALRSRQNKTGMCSGCYLSSPKYKQKMKDYGNRPGVKEMRRATAREYMRRPEVIKREKLLRKRRADAKRK